MQTFNDTIVRSAAISQPDDGSVGIMIEAPLFDPDLVTQVFIEDGLFKLEQIGRLLVEFPVDADMEAYMRGTKELRVINVVGFGRADETTTITEPLELQ